MSKNKGTSKMELSILIPTYNDDCYNLVCDIQKQASAVSGLGYEIIVGDDGSTHKSIVESIKRINSMEKCRVIRPPKNIGRAAIRNLLAREASYDWILYIDADMRISRQDFIKEYIEKATQSCVVYGGYEIPNINLKGNLRYKYEKSVATNHSAEVRQENPYKDFHTSNFLIRRDVMLYTPFNEQIKRYGYEDVLFGKELKLKNINILHIDNPVVFSTFESNVDFLRKTDEGITTLSEFDTLLGDYSRLVPIYEKLKRYHLQGFTKFVFQVTEPAIKRILTSRHPSLALFSFYKVGKYITMKSK